MMKFITTVIFLSVALTAFLIYLSWYAATCPCEWWHSCPKGFGYGFDCDPMHITTLQLWLDYLNGRDGMTITAALTGIGIIIPLLTVRSDRQTAFLGAVFTISAACSILLFRLFLSYWSI